MKGLVANQETTLLTKIDLGRMIIVEFNNNGTLRKAVSCRQRQSYYYSRTMVVSIATAVAMFLMHTGFAQEVD